MIERLGSASTTNGLGASNVTRTVAASGASIAVERFDQVGVDRIDLGILQPIEFQRGPG